LLDADAIAELLTARFGVSMLGEAADEAAGQRVRLRPRDVPRTQGFTVDVLIGWRAIDTEFTPASFGRALLASMELSTPDQRAVFGTFLRAAASDGAAIRFRINDQDADARAPSAWPNGWTSFTLSMQKGPMVIDGANPAGLQSLAVTWAGRIVGAALSLMPLEPVESALVGEAEGGATQVLVTRYERSSINRSACIEIHGALCKACGFDFERRYGVVGRGFIEVHHTQMVARLAPGTVLNPETDLVPVCANCHSMLHRRTPPYTVDELKTIISDAAHREITGN
jgi:5-methylcytosine-specific restriction enzyme A